MIINEDQRATLDDVLFDLDHFDRNGTVLHVITTLVQLEVIIDEIKKDLIKNANNDIGNE